MTNHDGQSSETFTEQATTWLVRLHQDWVTPSKRGRPRVTPSKRGRPRKRTPRNQFFLYLCRVRLGLLEVDLSCRFPTRWVLSAISLSSWANVVYLRLGSFKIRPTIELVVNSMPRTYCLKYPTRVIIDT